MSQVCELPDMFVCIIFLSVSDCRETNPLSPPAITDHLEPLWAPLLYHRAILPLSVRVARWRDNEPVGPQSAPVGGRGLWKCHARGPPPRLFF